MTLKVLALLALAPMAVGPALAHHGSAAYDDHLTTLKGTVTRFEFINPHALIYLDVSDGKGHVQQWIAELNSNNHLSRLTGWSRNALKPGDEVALAGHRAKNGSLVMDMQFKGSSLRKISGEELELEIFP